MHFIDLQIQDNPRRKFQIAISSTASDLITHMS